MLRLSLNTPVLLEDVRRLGEVLGLATGDLFDLFEEFDAGLTKQIKARFDRGGPGWDRLRPSTVAARERGIRKPTGVNRISRSQTFQVKSGYYRTEKPLGRVGPSGPIGQWTGKARRQAIKKGKVRRKSYTRDFGKKSTPARQRLEWLHKGGKNRNPRLIYVERQVRRLLKKKGDLYLKELVRNFNQADDLLGLERVLRQRGKL